MPALGDRDAGAEEPRRREPVEMGGVDAAGGVVGGPGVGGEEVGRDPGRGAGGRVVVDAGEGELTEYGLRWGHRIDATAQPPVPHRHWSG